MVPREAANITGLSTTSESIATTSFSQDCVESHNGMMVEGSPLNKVASMFKTLLKDVFASTQATLRRAKATRILGSLAVITFMVSVIPRTPLAGPIGGLIGMLSVLGCCWYAGLWTSLLIPVYVTILSRIVGTEPKPLLPTMQELTGVFVMTVLTGLTGPSRLTSGQEIQESGFP
jgi:hypothetical protein